MWVVFHWIHIRVSLLLTLVFRLNLMEMVPLLGNSGRMIHLLAFGLWLNSLKEKVTPGSSVDTQCSHYNSESIQYVGEQRSIKKRPHKKPQKTVGGSLLSQPSSCSNFFVINISCCKDCVHSISPHSSADSQNGGDLKLEHWIYDNKSNFNVVICCLLVNY